VSQKLIITFPDDMSAAEALVVTIEHIEPGKISTAAGIKHYCWATTFGGSDGGFVAYTNRKKSEKSADSIVISQRDAAESMQ
jgi:hypothetical protein